MAKSDQAKNTKGASTLGAIKDEPGADERFMRGVRKALNTPPRKHADEPKRRPEAGRKK